MAYAHLTTAGMSQSARYYRRFAACLAWLPGRAGALHRAIWLGLLDSRALNEITRLQYSDPNGFESAEHNFGGLWPWEQDVLRRFFADRVDVLVAGAGGGREAIALARQGCHVTAFDFCSALTTACRSHLAQAGLKSRVLDAPPDTLPSELSVYDGIYAGRGFYHHIPGRSRRVAFLKGCRRVTVPGAPLFLSDFFTRSTNDRPYERTFFIANVVRRLRRSPDAVEIGDWLSDCMQHAFVPGEIESELGEAGFQLVLYADSPFGQGSHLGHAVGVAQ
jgi:2-polyprenyl-3-methyl-5-hydroxy-6-metoxy-1,4-benzoquinol methylase